MIDYICSAIHLQLEIKNHVFFTPINWDDLYHKRITPPYNPNVVSEGTPLHMCLFWCPFSLNLIKNVYFPREVQLTPSTLIQSSPEKWFQVLWVGLQSSPPAPAPATPLTGSPSWPPRTASCEAGTLWREHFLHCCRLSLYSTVLCRDSPRWRWDTTRMTLLHHT